MNDPMHDPRRRRDLVPMAYVLLAEREYTEEQPLYEVEELAAALRHGRPTKRRRRRARHEPVIDLEW